MLRKLRPVIALPAGVLLALLAGNLAAQHVDAGRAAGALPTRGVPEIIVDVIDDPAPGTCTPGSCSLREAVALANQRPGLDRIILPKSLYLVLTRSGANEDGNSTGDLDITEEVELVGSGPANTVITQLAADRLFHTQGNDDHLTLRQLSLRSVSGSGMQNGGAILMANARLQIEDAMLIGHSATRLGGAIHHSGQAGRGISLLRVSFSNNFASNSDASDAFGGALYAVSSGAGADYLVIDDCAFTGNRADNGGGALALDAAPSGNGNNVIIRASDLIQNQVYVQGRGGAIATQVLVGGALQLHIEDSVLRNNSTPFDTSVDTGGAIDFIQGNLTIDRSIFSNNLARNGGAIRGATGTITDSTLCDNVAIDAGGAILAPLPLTIRRSTLCRNVVATGIPTEIGGGAVASSGASADLRIERSTLVDNRARRGGAIAFGQGKLAITGSTIVAPGMSGDDVGTVLDHTGTIAAGNTLAFSNSILQGSCNYAAAGLNPNSARGNIESDGNTCRLLLAPMQIENQTAVNSTQINLGPLADNGGPTDTRLPVEPSVAINAGNAAACIEPDQRGFAISDGECDVGAVEGTSSSLPMAIFADGFE